MSKIESIVIEHSVRIRLPHMPNYFIAADGETSIPVGELNDRTVDDIIKYWGMAFKEHVAHKRKQIK